MKGSASALKPSDFCASPGAVELEIRAAHARGLHLDHDFARARRGIGEVAHFHVPVAEKHSATHGMIL